MAKLSRDLAAPVGGNTLLHPRETLIAAGSLGSLNAEVFIPADGCASVGIDLRGTFSMTVEIAGTIDGVNWTLIPVRPLNIAATQYVAAITGVGPGIWAGKCAPFRAVRARCTAYTSGSASLTLVGDTAPMDDALQKSVTPLLGTNGGAAGAAVTLTLPAPGAGLRQYVTFLSINRFAAAALTAAAVPVSVSTTNLPGTLAFSLGAEALAQGALDRIREDFAMPLVASAQNTAVTIVCPATTSVIWRITAGYYVAP